MKRSEINRRLADAEAFFDEMHFLLPPWSRRRAADWKRGDDSESEILENMLGWDLTDFGSGDFDRVGLLLFTLRNGRPDGSSKPYAEKIMIVGEDQETPLHFHWSKMEDIIVRGGGRLAMQLWASTPDERLSDAPFSLRIDGVLREMQPGGTLVLAPGQSVCLERGIYHRFYAEPGAGRVLAGEVSAVNDDKADNRFYKPAGRFPEVEEDEVPYRLLVSDYAKLAR